MDDTCYYTTATSALFAFLFIVSEVIGFRHKEHPTRPKSLAEALQRFASRLSLRSSSTSTSS